MSRIGLFIILISGLICQQNSFSSNYTNITTTIGIVDSVDDEIVIDDPDNYRRHIPMQYYCYIDHLGVSIPGLNNTITLYEILDNTGTFIICSTPSETEFVEAIFSIQGDYIIRFETQEGSFAGYISL